MLIGNRYLPQIVTASSSGISSPLDISGAVLWLDASDTTKMFTDAGTTQVSADGQAVQQWNDKSTSAANATQTSAGDRPVYKTAIRNGKSILRFDGIVSNFSLALTRSSENRTVFIVAGNIPTAGTIKYFFDSETGRFVLAQLGNTANTVQFYDGSWVGSAAATATFQCLTYRLASAGAEIYRNGASIATGAHTNKAIGGSTRIGANYVPDGSFLSMDLCEMVIYNSALSTTDRQSVESYLTSKWAL